MNNIGSKIASGFSSIVSSASAAVLSLGTWVTTGVKGFMTSIGVSFTARFPSNNEQKTRETDAGQAKSTIQESVSNASGSPIAASFQPPMSVRPNRGPHSNSSHASHVKGEQKSVASVASYQNRADSSRQTKSLADGLRDIDTTPTTALEERSSVADRSRAALEQRGATNEGFAARGEGLDRLHIKSDNLHAGSKDYATDTKKGNKALEAESRKLDMILNFMTLGGYSALGFGEKKTK